MDLVDKYLTEAKRITFKDLDEAPNKSSAHAGGQWFAEVGGKNYVWNYVYNKNGQWAITNKPEQAEAIAVSKYANKDLKVAKIIKK